MAASSRMSSTSQGLSRRSMIEGGALFAVGAALIEGAPAHAAAAAGDPIIPVPLPVQMPAKEGIADLRGTRLAYWDTGGDGPAIVLLHPSTGSLLMWGYQQPVFANAGYRVIAYSRRGHYHSEPVPRENPGSASQDLHNLVEFLGIRKFHAVASAAGAAGCVQQCRARFRRPAFEVSLIDGRSSRSR